MTNSTPKALQIVTKVAIKSSNQEQLLLRKLINSKLLKLCKSISTRNKAKYRVEISSLEQEFKNKYGYGMKYNWE